jgi:DNA-binding NtrC family response regulator
MTEIKAIHPAVPVLLMTGYSDEHCCKSDKKMKVADYISKPFNPVLLLSMLYAFR